jgi:hypothetical protein
MSLVTRKLIIDSLIVAILLLANFLIPGEWLDRVGVIGWAQWLRTEYITGAAIAVIVALLILLPETSRYTGRSRIDVYHCPVCDTQLAHPGRYCPTCGSRL